MTMVNLAPNLLCQVLMAWANIDGADVSERCLSRSTLCNASLSGTNLEGTVLDTTDLRWTNLENTSGLNQDANGRPFRQARGLRLPMVGTNDRLRQEAESMRGKQRRGPASRLSSRWKSLLFTVSVFAVDGSRA